MRLIFSSQLRDNVFACAFVKRFAGDALPTSLEDTWLLFPNWRWTLPIREFLPGREVCAHPSQETFARSNLCQGFVSFAAPLQLRHPLLRDVWVARFDHREAIRPRSPMSCNAQTLCASQA